MIKTAIAFLSALFIAFAGPALAAPSAELWDLWLKHQPGSEENVDHGLWDRLLRTHVKSGPDGIALVDYSAFSAQDRADLNRYLEQLSASAVSRFDRPQQMAFWINLYNALTVRIILDHYPVESIRDIDISPGFFSDGPWGKKLITVEGTQISLDDIEHRILRPVWKDPRIHYAVNCASLGCPDLAGRAYFPDRLDRQLDQAARAFINHPRAVRIENDKLSVSSIYDWFSSDFGGNDKEIIAHLRRFAAPELRAQLAGIRHIDGDGYDWRLNDSGN